MARGLASVFGLVRAVGLSRAAHEPRRRASRQLARLEERHPIDRIEVALPTSRDGGLRALNEARLRANWAAASALTGWSAFNLVTGSAGWRSARGRPARRFHQANALFNVAILGSALASFYAIARQDLGALGLHESLRRGVALERWLLLGIGFDVATGVAGALLWRSGRRERSARLKGWGRSLALQGSVLVLFDSAVQWMNARFDSRLLASLAPGGERRGRALPVAANP